MRLAELIKHYLDAPGPQPAPPPPPRDYGAKVIVLPVTITNWPTIWRERYEERAAIIEFCAGKTRRQAEEAAFAGIRREAEAKSIDPPDSAAQQMSLPMKPVRSVGVLSS
jgi:hypothetical protein